MSSWKRLLCTDIIKFNYFEASVVTVTIVPLVNLLILFLKILEDNILLRVILGGSLFGPEKFLFLHVITSFALFSGPKSGPPRTSM